MYVPVCKNNILFPLNTSGRFCIRSVSPRTALPVYVWSNSIPVSIAVFAMYSKSLTIIRKNLPLKVWLYKKDCSSYISINKRAASATITVVFSMYKQLHNPACLSVYLYMNVAIWIHLLIFIKQPQFSMVFVRKQLSVKLACKWLMRLMSCQLDEGTTHYIKLWIHYNPVDISKFFCYVKRQLMNIFLLHSSNYFIIITKYHNWLKK